MLKNNMGYIPKAVESLFITNSDIHKYNTRNKDKMRPAYGTHRAGNWWKITNSNRTTVHYGGPPQTVVINCNPQIHQTHEITGINQTERLAGQ